MPPNELKRERLRFQDFDFQAFPDGRCSVTVVLEWSEGQAFTGEAEGTQTLEGGLRCGAVAALRAAEGATAGQLSFDLLGVKAVRAFDQWIVIVSVRGRGEQHTYRLLGSYATSDEGETARGASFAVLDATNRILERYLG